MAILGIDIGGTRIKAGVVAGDGTLGAHAAVGTPATLEDFRDALCDLARHIIDGAEIEAAGFGCKGIINARSTRVDVLPGTLHYLEGHVLSELIAPVLGRRTPVFADNDARVALAGELAWGAARGHSDVVMLTLGTGVGGAILSGGRLVRGHSGVAGHLGHLTIDPDGPLCICGNRGCLETLFSSRAIESEAHAAVHRGVDSLLTRRYAGDLQALTCEAVFETAREGDTAARLIVYEAVRALGAAIAGLVHALDPEIVIVGGQIAQAGDALFEPLTSEVQWRTHGLLRRTVPLVPPQVADASGVVGAAALTLAGAS